MSSRRHISVVIDNAKRELNEMCRQIIRDAHPDIDFTFTVATTVPGFIQLACNRRTDLALLMPPGNIEPDPARPYTTPQEEAVHIVETIKARHPIPVIVVAVASISAAAFLLELLLLRWRSVEEHKLLIQALTLAAEARVALQD